MSQKKIVIVGAGSYGTALACHWAKFNKTVAILTRQNPHEIYEKNRELKDVTISTDKNILKDAACIFMAIPSQTYRTYITDLIPFIEKETPIIIASKGLEQKTQFFLSDILANEIKNPILIWSGPQFASEIAQHMPSGVTLGCLDSELAASIVTLLTTPYLRIYPSYDLKGIQLTGALKNVIAIACGIARGKGMGGNTTAAILTRGLAEIRRLGLAMGAQVETFLGLSSVGDLFLTCSSSESRNTAFGIEIGQEKNIEDLLKRSTPLVEGIYTVEAAYKLSRKYNVYMPISTAIYKLLYLNEDLDMLIHEILLSTTQWENA
jgi:glycerol-3-phosphate dehydrogenase (NAD(P)+)